MTRGQKGYDKRKAKVERQEANREKEIDTAMERQTQGRRALSGRQLQALGYKKNWRGKWVGK